MRFPFFGKRNKTATLENQTSTLENKTSILKNKTATWGTKTSTLEKDGSSFQWPRLWIMIIGILLIFLCLVIAGMEVGNTVSDLRRATAFGGFIAFPFLLACAVLVLVTAFKPRFILRRIALILCIIMIILCLVLIAYDIIIVIDPTRCFFLDCNSAAVNASNSTTINIVYGWPVYIAWPNSFQTNMNIKRVLQGIQMVGAGLFILLAALYILTYFIYQIVNLNKKKEIYIAERPVLVSRGTAVTPTKQSIDTVQSFPQYSLNHFMRSYTADDPTKPSIETAQSDSPYKHLIRTYTIDGRPTELGTKASGKTKKKTYLRPRTNSVSVDRICTRCEKEPRIVLTTKDDRQKYFSNLCVNCNNEISATHHKPPSTRPTTDHGWKS